MVLGESGRDGGGGGHAGSNLLLLLGDLLGKGCCVVCVVPCSIGTPSTGGTIDLANKGCNGCPWRTGGEIGEIGEACA